MKIMRKHLGSLIFSLVALLILGQNVSASSFLIDFLNFKETIPQAGEQNLAAYIKVKAVNAWELLNSGIRNLSPTTIGIIDTGFDATHPEFDGIDFGKTPNEARSDSGDLINGILESHGTNVAGIIGSNNISATSAANYIFPHMNGLVSGAKNLNYTLEIRKYGGRGIRGIFSAVLQTYSVVKVSSRVVNLSFTTFHPVGSALFESLFRAYPETLFVVAANDYRLPPPISSILIATPADLGFLDNVITVGATTLTDQRLPESDFGAHIKIAAPGEFVWSPTFYNAPLDLSDYRYFFGTSASAPMVTGVAAILKSLNPSLTPADIKRILQIGADPIVTDQPLGSGCFDPARNPYGYTGCRLNAFRAVQYALAQPVTILREFSAPISGNGRGLAFDGSNLYYTNRNDTRVFKIDTQGNLLQTFQPTPPLFPYALAWDGTQLWGTIATSTYGVVFGTADFSVSATPTPRFTFDYPVDDSCYGSSIDVTDGLDYDFQTGRLWFSDDGGRMIYNALPDGTAVRNFPLPVGQCNSGVAVSRNSAWAILFDEPDPDATYLTSRLTRFTKDGTEVFPELRLPGVLYEDAAFDSSTFAPKCAIWAIQNGFVPPGASSQITAFQVPCE